MNQFGQLAFESLLVLLIILSSASLIVTLYLQFHDETIALGYARTGAIEELSKQNENIIIEKINLTRKLGIPTITITLDRLAFIDTTKIENTIKSNTALENIKVEVISIRQ